MATITEDYVSFETAKLLKDKGFDGVCSMVYTIEGELLFVGLLHHNLNTTSNTHSKYFSDIIVTSPTLQMAMKWLREVYDLIIYVKLINDGDIYHDAWGFVIYNKFTNKYVKSDKLCFKYEQACEVAIKYCLEHLI